MPDKLARAQHIRRVDPGSTSEIFVGGSHAGLDRTVIAAAVAEATIPKPVHRHNGEDKKEPLDKTSTEKTASLFVGGSHAGVDLTALPADPFEVKTSFSPTKHAQNSLEAPPIIFPAHHHPKRSPKTSKKVESSAALIGICTMISRVLGFVRTWTMAFALGSTLLASSYQVAYNLPSQLYELVVGGMIVTAFLPVYLTIKKKLTEKQANSYASNLLSIVVILLGIVTIACIIFPAQFIYTQSFYSNQSQMAQSIFFFQFFAIQIVFSGATAIISGLLNANRDYVWSSIAPAINNVIVIITFLSYSFIAPHHQQLALYIIAIGNPLGVFVALAIQLPALKRNGIHLRPHINLRDPALKETLSIGVPAVFVMLCSFVVVSIQTAAAYSFADNGPSILLYARQWFTLPYAFLAVPITTAMFTELADMQAEENTAGLKRGILGGINQILFFMIPFALYLIVFSLPLVMLFRAGAFSVSSVSSIASYLAILALGLPVYGINTYLQKIFSSLRKMKIFAGFNLAAGVVQIALTMFGAAHVAYFPLEIIAVAEVLFYVIADIGLIVYLRSHLGPFGLRSVARATLSATLLGGFGALAGGSVLLLLQVFIGPLNGSIPQALAYVVIGGIISLVITFGLALRLKIPEAAFVSSLIHKLAGRLAMK